MADITAALTLIQAELRPRGPDSGEPLEQPHAESPGQQPTQQESLVKSSLPTPAQVQGDRYDPIAFEPEVVLLAALFE